MQLIWTEDSLEDRDAIFEYIAASNPAAALDLDDKFVRSAERLSSNPGLGRAGKLHGTRELIIYRHYMLVYDVAGNVLRILGVVHTARRWLPAPV